MEEKEKTVVVKYETWLRLQKLRKFPERGSFDAVINELLDKAVLK
ncbi:MAG TPA: hypothetical protein VMW25_04800 [Clostridia bacterium]|nr:hypothetical protein [Clostridia bacterium]